MDGDGWTVLTRYPSCLLWKTVTGKTMWPVFSGDLNGEFFLGLEKIHRITTGASSRLRIELKDSYSKEEAYAEYSTFSVSGSS